MKTCKTNNGNNICAVCCKQTKTITTKTIKPIMIMI